jgi:hypothetical protein
MTDLQKASIVEITSDEKAKEIGPRFPVQFNPTTLKLQIATGKAGGTPSGSQVRQSTGSSTSTLTLELVFDTADEGTTDKPCSVREKTANLERFVYPKLEGQDNQKPPKMRFQWGGFVFDGVVDSVNIDIDHFASDGTPLRAKVSLSIQEQNSKLIFRAAGPGANQQGGAARPGQPSSGALGSQGGLVNKVAAALGGESLPDFAARQGLDPAAWRGLSTGVSGSLNGDLSLEAGVEVGFSAGLSANAGLGVTLGFEAGLNASLEASFGLETSVQVGGVAGLGIDTDLAAGFSLSAAGGLSAALETVQKFKNETAEQQARQAFQAPPALGPASSGASAASPATSVAATPALGATPKPAPPEQPRTPLTLAGFPSPTQQVAAVATPAPPKADPRSTTFGSGVPLRSRISPAAGQRAETLQGQVSLKSKTGNGLPPSTSDPTTPAWIALPARDTSRSEANKIQMKRQPMHPCSCTAAGREGLDNANKHRKS